MAGGAGWRQAGLTNRKAGWIIIQSYLVWVQSMTEEEGRASSTQADLASNTRETFAGDNRPVTVEMLARNYAALIEQQEISMAMFSVIMKLKPDLIFTDEITALQSKMRANINGLAADLSFLNEGLENE